MTTRLSLACVLVAASACTHTPRTALVGNAIIQARSENAELAPPDDNATPWAVGSSMRLRAGTYDVAMQFDLPRPQRVDWTLTCPGSEQTDTLHATQRTRIVLTTRVTTTGAGVCALVAITDDGDVIGTYRITRAGGEVAPVMANDDARALAEARVQAASELAAIQRLEQAEALRVRTIRTRLEHRPVLPAKVVLDVTQVRLDRALAARTSLRLRFEQHGAVARPAMPDPIDETPTEPPYDDATWVAGAWSWKATSWIWQPGRWIEAGSSEVAAEAWGDEDPLLDPTPWLGVGDNEEGAAAGLWITRPDGTRRPRPIPHSDAIRSMGHVRDHRTAKAPGGSSSAAYSPAFESSSSSSSGSSRTSDNVDDDKDVDSSVGTFTRPR